MSPLNLKEWARAFGLFRRSKGIALVGGIWLAAGVTSVAAFLLGANLISLESAAAKSEATMQAFQQMTLSTVDADQAHYAALAKALTVRYPNVQAKAAREGLRVEVKDVAHYENFEAALAYIAGAGGTTRYEAVRICTGATECKGSPYQALIRGKSWLSN